jgi:hypothetical protein
VFEETTIAIFWACIVKYISLSKEFESILTLLKKKEVLKIYNIWFRVIFYKY